MKIKLLIALLIFNSFQGLQAKDCGQEKQGFEEGISYFNSENFLLSSQVFSSVRIFGDADCEYAFEAAYFQTASFLKLQDLKAFELSMVTAAGKAKTEEQRERTKLLRAFAYDSPELTGVNLDLSRRWASWDQRKNLDLSDLGTVELAEIHHKYATAAHTKKPWLAGTLSAVLPGAGQAYVGAYQSAVLAFAFNALLLGATIEFSRRDLDFAAATSGLAFSMTYLGNIASAVKGANSVNQSRSSGWEEALRRGLLPELRF
ncbi:MAG TPA: hypothetical protein VNJ01_12140 [Bacteriovoracaceae bacterium]|nr:hypothetical protein [Bacteriovoracaceae bacterium]